MILGRGRTASARVSSSIIPVYTLRWCCVRWGTRRLWVNCNPETVSTDYDVSTRLYFEPLTLEDVLEIVESERRTGGLLGVFVQLGGQTPLKLAKALKDAGVPILGTTPEAIDLAEDRGEFARVLEEGGLISPNEWYRIYLRGRQTALLMRLGTRCWFVPPMCWAGAVWRSSMTKANLATLP